MLVSFLLAKIKVQEKGLQIDQKEGNGSLHMGFALSEK